MKHSVEEVSSIKRKITVEASPEEVDAAWGKALAEVRREAKVPGFRKGKVPDQMLLTRFGDDIAMEAAKAVVSKTLTPAVREVGIFPLGEPRIEPEGVPEKGKPFTYHAHYEVYPEVTAKGYEKLNLEREKATVTDEEVETELTRMQQQMTQLEPAAGEGIGPGMVAMIDFKGTADGKPFPGSEAENYVVDFGSGRLLKEFENEIVGMKGGEKGEINFTYPTDYFKKEVAGKAGCFQISVKEVRRKIVPELNDDFAKELGQYKTLDEVRAELKKRIVEYKDAVWRGRLKDQAIRQIIEANKELEVPMALVDGELGNMLEQLKQQVESRGQTFDQSKIDPKQFVQTNLEEATNRARGFMLVRAISEQEKVALEDAELDERIEAIAAQQKQPVDRVRQQLEKNNQLDNLRGQILFDKTLDLVLTKAKIKEKKPEKTKK